MYYSICSWECIVLKKTGNCDFSLFFLHRYYLLVLFEKGANLCCHYCLQQRTLSVTSDEGLYIHNYLCANMLSSSIAFLLDCTSRRTCPLRLLATLLSMVRLGRMPFWVPFRIIDAVTSMDTT